MKAIYVGFCPSCEGDITDEELLGIGVCRKCAPKSVLEPSELYSRLKSKRRSTYLKVLKMQLELEEFSKFFKRLHKVRPWSLQEVWARRVLLGHSFSVVAPTGMGKTTFGLTMALYLAKKGRRSYVMVPSSLLVQHLLDKVKEFCEREYPRLVEMVVGYYSGMNSRDSSEALKKIEEGDFKVLITTDRFLYNKFDLVSRFKFDFVFVDDVDSFLRSPRNIDKSLALLGFSKDVVEKALRVVNLMRKRKLSTEEEEELTSLGEQLDLETIRPSGILVVSGATLRGRLTTRVRLFRYLLGFEPGFSPEFVRNILNVFLTAEGTVESEVVKLVRKYGPGCLIYVPQTRGIDFALAIEKALKDEGIPCAVYQKMYPKLLDRFVKGEYHALIGIASNRSPLARGVDLPEHVRYAIFAGVPRRELRVSRKEANPSLILALLRNMAPILTGNYATELTRHIATLSKLVPLRAEVLEKVREAIEKGTELEGFERHVLTAVRDAMQFVEKVVNELTQKAVAERIDVSVKITEDGYSIIIPDELGYIQASGRTSRLYAGGISRGIAITVVDDKKAFHGLAKRIQVMIEEGFVEYDEGLLTEEFRRVDEDRKKISLIKRGLLMPEEAELMRSALIIVESPTKSHTIASMFGRPARRQVGELTVYESSSGEMIVSVVATQGHVVDLSTVRGYYGVVNAHDSYIPVYTDIRKCLKCGEQFTDHATCPKCGSREIRTKKSTIETLRLLAAESDKVLVATDPDSEGEKIGYDVYCLLHPYNKDIQRMEFHEVTRKAIRAALSSPTHLKIPLVEAQTVRRIEDRWIGFELSKKLWERFGKRTLSAGRVQTPVLGWIIKQVEESKKRKKVLQVTLEDGTKVEFIDRSEEFNAIEEKFKSGTLIAEIEELERREVAVNPPPPYTTDSMLKDAANLLGFKANYAMRLAQSLFESGLITYHRTDSTSVSSTGMSVARQYIEENELGPVRLRAYRSEGAHECIRPTKSINSRQLEYYINAGLQWTLRRIGRDELRLYDLIFRRFIASQMAEARIEVQTLLLRLNGLEKKIERIVKILEPGFLHVLPTIRESDPMRVGAYKVVDLKVRTVPAAWPLREGDVIALMKDRGIGRPSTYSKIISVLFERGYVFDNAGRLISTKLGKQVFEFLIERYGNLVSEELTRQLESTMDAVERGELNYQDVLRSLHKEIELLAKH